MSHMKNLDLIVQSSLQEIAEQANLPHPERFTEQLYHIVSSVLLTHMADKASNLYGSVLSMELARVCDKLDRRFQ